ncbi:MAG TPA: [LysW]-lysine hydrolase [Chloroflexota bacterium]|nr:[LysW]-lysine hydrolase [Chloroflexota bacterium]
MTTALSSLNLRERGTTLDDRTLLRRMLEIRSLSGQERSLAEFLREEMRARGFQARIDEAGNAVGEQGTAGSGPTIVLLGHMDTAPGEVPVRQDGDILQGRGAVDAKGPLAAFIAAATAYEGPGRVVVIGAVEEESATAKGARHAVAQYQPDAAIIGEPSAWDRVTVGYKGRLLAEYQGRQPSAHTAGQHPSVCDRAVRFWHRTGEAIDAVNAERASTIFDRLQGSLRTMQSTSDGLEDSATLTMGFRLPTPFDIAAWRETLRALAGEDTLRFHAYEPAVRVDKNTPLARAMLTGIRALGGRPRYAVKTGTSDLNVVAEHWRCPLLAYGPGDASLDHTPNEHIDLKEYDKAIAILRTALAELALTLPTRSMQLVEIG